MYQEDMINEGDGCGGMPIPPKIKIQSSASAEPPFAIVGRGSLEDVPNEELGEVSSPLPYNGSELSSDNIQRQYHEYPGRKQVPPDATEHVVRFNRSRSRSSSPTRGRDEYVLMPAAKNDNPKRKNKRTRRQKAETFDDVDDRYAANVALSIQFAMIFFCMLILIAIIMSVFSIQGYVVVVVVCLVILVSLLIGLCTFIYQVLNEDDSPRMNSRHMPKWYKTLTKIIKDEIADFREDWKDMYNGMYLLEDGDAGTASGNNEDSGSGNKDKSKKRRKGKSAVFKMIAKPAAVFANFRRKRKEKKKQKKAEKAAAESYFPPVV